MTTLYNLLPTSISSVSSDSANSLVYLTPQSIAATPVIDHYRQASVKHESPSNNSAAGLQLNPSWQTNESGSSSGSPRMQPETTTTSKDASDSRELPQSEEPPKLLWAPALGPDGKPSLYYECRTLVNYAKSAMETLVWTYTHPFVMALAPHDTPVSSNPEDWKLNIAPPREFLAKQAQQKESDTPNCMPAMFGYKNRRTMRNTTYPIFRKECEADLFKFFIVLFTACGISSTVMALAENYMMRLVNHITALYASELATQIGHAHCCWRMITFPMEVDSNERDNLECTRMAPPIVKESSNPNEHACQWNHPHASPDQVLFNLKTNPDGSIHKSTFLSPSHRLPESNKAEYRCLYTNPIETFLAAIDLATKHCHESVHVLPTMAKLKEVDGAALRMCQRAVLHALNYNTSYVDLQPRFDLPEPSAPFPPPGCPKPFVRAGPCPDDLTEDPLESLLDVHIRNSFNLIPHFLWLLVNTPSTGGFGITPEEYLLWLVYAKPPSWINDYTQAWWRDNAVTQAAEATKRMRVGGKNGEGLIQFDHGEQVRELKRMVERAGLWFEVSPDLGLVQPRPRQIQLPQLPPPPPVQESTAHPQYPRPASPVQESTSVPQQQPQSPPQPRQQPPLPPSPPSPQPQLLLRPISPPPPPPQSQPDLPRLVDTQTPTPPPIPSEPLLQLQEITNNNAPVSNTEVESETEVTVSRRSSSKDSRASPNGNTSDTSGGVKRTMRRSRVKELMLTPRPTPRQSKRLLLKQKRIQEGKE